MVWNDPLCKKSLLVGGGWWWQTKFNVWPRSGSLDLGPDLGPGPDLDNNMIFFTILKWCGRIRNWVSDTMWIRMGIIRAGQGCPSLQPRASHQE